MSLTRMGSPASARTLAAASRPDMGRLGFALRAPLGLVPLVGRTCLRLPFLAVPPDVGFGGLGLAALRPSSPPPAPAPPGPTSPATAGTGAGGSLAALAAPPTSARSRW